MEPILLCLIITDFKGTPKKYPYQFPSSVNPQSCSCLYTWQHTNDNKNVNYEMRGHYAVHSTCVFNKVCRVSAEWGTCQLLGVAVVL